MVPRENLQFRAPVAAEVLHGGQHHLQLFQPAGDILPGRHKHHGRIRRFQAHMIHRRRPVRHNPPGIQAPFLQHREMGGGLSGIVDKAGDVPGLPPTPGQVSSVKAQHHGQVTAGGTAAHPQFLVRKPSPRPGNGVGGVLNCGCPLCAAEFKAEGIDIEMIKEEWEEKGDDFLSVKAYTPSDGFVFTNPAAADFFKAKGHIVSKAVASIADSLRKRGLEIGMDLYAPFMSPFVGQDYEILAAHADFIKPMLYRQTFAPAGMGFEYDLLKKAVPGASGYPEFAMDLDFLHSQLEAMESYSCAKFPGIEINYRKEVVPTSPEYVTESLEAVKSHGFEGIVLSWNIMEAPLAHLDCLK